MNNWFWPVILTFILLSTCVKKYDCEIDKDPVYGNTNISCKVDKSGD